MACRLSAFLQNAKRCTSWFLTIFLCSTSYSAYAQTLKSNAYYEIVVVESLPEDMTLDMSLKEITDAKNRSRVGETKKNIYSFLNKTFSPLLSEYSASDNKSLVDLAANLPISTLIEGLVEVNNGVTDPSKVTPADFMIVIFPKIPDSANVAEGTDLIASLYSKNKASVIDVKWDDYSMVRSYQELINKRLEKSIKYMYKRQFIELERNDPFFVGALFNVHLEGEKTYIKTQLVGSLPTGLTEVFENANDQVHLKHAHSPKAPTKKSIDKHQDFPGVILEFTHKPGQQNLMSLSLKFGSLGSLDGKTWAVKNKLQKIEETIIDKILGVGLDFTTKFNVPFLTGDLKEGAAGATMAKLYTVKINIHEVQVNVNKIEIEKVRVSLDLQPIVDEERVRQSLEVMRYSPYGPAYIPGAGAPPLPTIEIEDISRQFTVEGNKALEPVREKLQNVLAKSPEQLLNDPKVQAEILDFILNYMKSKQVKVGGSK